MKQKLLRIFSLGMLLSLLTAFAPTAAAAAADIMFNDPSVIVGSTATVNVYSTANVAGVDLTLIYDAEYLTYTGFSGGLGNASVQDRGGSLSIVDYSGSGAAHFSLNLSFTTKKIGQTTLRATACTVSDGGGDFLDTEYASHSSCVTVTSASTDCTLRALYIEPGTLSPGFSSGTTSYSVTVPNSTTWLAVTPEKNDNAATYTISGNDWLNVGLNYVTITVTAGNGAQKSYTLAVTRLAAESAAKTQDNTVDTAPEVVPVTVKSESGAVLTVGTFAAENIPAGFEGTEITIGMDKVSAIRSKDGKRTALWCGAGENLSEGFYLYDAEKETVTPMDTLTAPGGTYTILDVSLLSSRPPEGCSIGTVTVGEREISAFVPEDSTDYAILYAVNPAGESGYYLYDMKETTLQRLGLYGGDLAEESPSPTPEATPGAITLDDPEESEVPTELTRELKAQKLKTKIFAIASGALLLAAAAMGIVLIRKEDR